MTTTMSGEELIRTPVGRLHVGDAVHVRRVGFGTKGKAGGRWLQARTVDREHGRWITGTDKNGRVITARVEDITMIDRKRVVWTSPESYKPRPRGGR